MTLPIRQLPTGEFRFDDDTVIPIRGLSRAEALQLRGLQDDIPRLEVLTISFATTSTVEESEAFHGATSNEEVGRLVDEIAKLSGFDIDTGKADAEDSPSANLIELITSLQRISDSLSAKSDS